ncbi:MAG: hypothetical protein HN580_08410 [Deltaproteobacteria bacterium]|nr:hypothetical protein [Deltaproteobacteria bacterium]
MMNDDLYKTDNSPQLRLLLDQKELLNLELNNTLTDWEKQQAVLDELTSTSS